MHLNSLASLKLDAVTHMNGVRKVVNLTCAMISEVVGKHNINKNALSSVLQQYFGLNIIGMGMAN